jgi:DNA-directed RNA polymerase subunit RPC12/RpoP
MYFIQICPICGRRLEVKIEYIGLEVSCYHCRGRFLAQDSESQSNTQVSLHSSSFSSQQDCYSDCHGYSGEENTIFLL